ncbi:MAG: DNA cytosine methyltransferase [Bacteroidia bacterium]
MIRHGSLFAGLGGFDYAADLAGFETKFHCEIDEFCQRILKYYWPKAHSYDDIRKTDFTIWRGLIDVLTGGFPCQPFSVAGTQKGIEDERHLWPEMLRAIREIAPRWVVGENVRGLVNWNGGMVFDQVQIDLENEGYKVITFILPASAVNAPHRRDRIWFVAYSDRHDAGRCGHGKIGSAKEEFEARNWSEFERIGKAWNAANTNGVGLRVEGDGFGESGFIGQTNTANDWRDFPTQSPICFGNDGLSSKLDGIAFSKWRRESIKGFGNAVVPQLALQIFNTIKIYEAS